MMAPSAGENFFSTLEFTNGGPGRHNIDLMMYSERLDDHHLPSGKWWFNDGFLWDFMGFYGGLMGFNMIYPQVMTNKKLLKMAQSK